MLRSLVKDLQGRHIAAHDGEIGSVVDTYFDDASWTVRYLVVDTGDWLPGRKVLISPASLLAEQGGKGAVRVDLNRAQVRDSPDADSDQPVSRQFEEAHARYYGYPFYWDGPYLWGNTPHPVSGSASVTLPPSGPAMAERTRELREAERRARESTLRSAGEVAGYRVVASDGPIGHIEDFLVDAVDWALKQLVVDTGGWLSGHKVALPPTLVREIDWITREVRVNASREEVRAAPPAT